MIGFFRKALRIFLRLMSKSTLKEINLGLFLVAVTVIYANLTLKIDQAFSKCFANIGMPVM